MNKFSSLQSCFSFSTDSSWDRFGLFKPHVNSTESSIRTPALDDFLNAELKNQKPPGLQAPVPHQCLYIFHISFYCKLLSFFIAIHKKKHISLYLQFTVKLLAQFPDTRVLFPDISVLFCGNEGIFFRLLFTWLQGPFSWCRGRRDTYTKTNSCSHSALPVPPSDSRPRSIGSPAHWRACFKAVQSFTDEQCSLLVPLRHSFVTTVLM